MIKNFNRISTILYNEDALQVRKFLVKNYKGIGYKVASHFLRNVGYKDIAIIDRHILRFLYENKYIKSIPKNITHEIYLKLENILRKIARDYDISLAELDLYIWYDRTGMVLK